MHLSKPKFHKFWKLTKIWLFFRGSKANICHFLTVLGRTFFLPLRSTLHDLNFIYTCQGLVEVYKLKFMNSESLNKESVPHKKDRKNHWTTSLDLEKKVESETSFFSFSWGKFNFLKMNPCTCQNPNFTGFQKLTKIWLFFFGGLKANIGPFSSILDCTFFVPIRSTICDLNFIYTC